MPRHPQPWRRAGRGWFVTLAGKQYPLGDDKQAAFARYHELMALGPPAAVAARVAGPGLAEVADEFLQWTLDARSPRTFEFYRDFLQSFVAHAERDQPRVPLADVRPKHVQAWLSEHPTWGATTRRSAIGTVQRCFNWAERMGHLDRTPLRGFEKPAAVSRDRVITPDEYQTLLAATPDEEFRSLLTAAWETGARPQELRAVERRHFEEPQSRWVFPVKESKGRRRPRVVYLTQVVHDLAVELRDKWPEGPLFRNTNGAAWTAYAVICRFKSLKRKTGIHACLYHFRHTFATRKLREGIDPLTVALWLGHANVAMLATTYQHLSLDPTHLLNRLRGGGPRGSE
ncbi:MAG: tyrosine-type recombinase/integrase [Lacipirellulaceae bacterium]